jgi:sugar phosphate isomerase/epimerase
MSHKASMKPGFVQFIYMPPQDIKDPFEGLKWQLNELAAMGGKVLNGMFGFPEEPAKKEELKALLASKGLEVEPYAMGWQGLTGNDKAKAREDLEKSIANAKYYGATVLRSAYNGRLIHELSRFNKKIAIKDHMKTVIDGLKEAAKIFEANGVYLAIENHCDFTGKEFAEIFSAVGNKHVGSGFDTANGYTVYQDPNDEIEYVAEFTISAHIKDMSVDQFSKKETLRTVLNKDFIDATAANIPMDHIPYLAQGCAVGDGNVDIPKMIDWLDKKSPYAEGMHLIIEQGWMYVPEGETGASWNAKCLKKGMPYLKSLLKD